MLGTVKKVAYNADEHSIHFFYLTREHAERFVDLQIPFRHRKLPVVNVHEPDTIKEPSDIWKRQVATDGIKDKTTPQLYRIQLLNISPFMDVSRFSKFLEANTMVPFELDECDKGAQSPQHHSFGPWYFTFLDAQPFWKGSTDPIGLVIR
uniref:Uncharacterized protein n=1 Tax=Globisporangium ultimum (strain ATCC 200006 / CBS 805.95 / DAOM BR144) TaxID=431595 RepID=K3WHA3_GLOUD